VQHYNIKTFLKVKSNLTHGKVSGVCIC